MAQSVNPMDNHSTPCMPGPPAVQDHVANSMADYPTSATDPIASVQSRRLIGDMIRQSLMPQFSGDQSRQFLPQDEMERIMSFERIKAILTEAGVNKIDVGKDICGKGKTQKRIKILTILSLMEQPQYIKDFLKHGVFDDQLPIRSAAELFSDWRLPDADNFYNRQYVVLAPVLDFTTMDHKSFSPGTPMPFLIPLEWNSEGRHGQVCKVKIHDQHQNWGHRFASKARDSCYALKRFHMEANGNFEGERQALIRFSGPKGKHDNLIELLLSYRIDDNQYLIFPWADGDLKEYWSRTQNDPTSLQHAQRLIGQCLGLAKGLCQVHHYHNSSRLHNAGAKALFTRNRNRGRHGDIKPKNILYFADENGGPERLVIADFTLMRFHSDATTSITYANQVGFSSTYRPPEVDKRMGPIVSQKYDIWTLGCVYLEFITWHLLGCDAVYRRSFRTADEKEFESFSTVRLTDDDKRHGMEEDKFFNSTRSGQVVKPSVKRVSKFVPPRILVNGLANG
ncbi:hypothetical protein FAVG1_06083 [Fusarium avenaceum]|nr:hypothetical protein FAVG1_06083 [Fusarium avenaceum]